MTEIQCQGNTLTKESKTWEERTSRMQVRMGGKRSDSKFKSRFLKESQCHPSIHLFIQKYFLSIYYVPNTILEIRNTSENKKDKNSF